MAGLGQALKPGGRPGLVALGLGLGGLLVGPGGPAPPLAVAASWAGLATVCLAAPAQGAEEELFIRQRRVQGAPLRGGEAFVPAEALGRYLEAEELARVELDPAAGIIRVDGQALEARLLAGDPPRVPLVALARALGFELRRSPALGFLDLVPPKALKPRERPQQTERGGPEVREAEARMIRLRLKHGEVDDPEALARIRRIGDELVAVSTMPRLVWSFYILDDPRVNAATTGPGYVMVTRGLLRLGLTDSELAGVLAHEIGHGVGQDLLMDDHHRQKAQDLAGQIPALEAAERDVRARLERLEGVRRRLRAMGPASSAAESVERMELEREADSAERTLLAELRRVRSQLQQAQASLKQSVARVQDPFWSQSGEVDADLRGLRMAVAAGYPPEGLLQALRRIAGADPGEQQTAAFEGASSHPPAAARIRILEKVLQDWRSQGWTR